MTGPEFEPDGARYVIPWDEPTCSVLSVPSLIPAPGLHKLPRGCTVLPVSTLLTTTEGHTVNTAASVTETGTIVWGRPVREGKPGTRRKGIVLGTMTDDTTVVVVWWYGEGEASMGTTTMAYVLELAAAGDVWDLSSRQARHLEKLANGFSRARVLTGILARHARRLESIGL